MSNSHKGLLKELVYCLLILAVIAGSLFLIFSFLAMAEVSELMGFSLFLVVAGLLIVGYMVALMFVALAGIMVLAQRLGKPSG